MFIELDQADYQHIQPLIQALPRDPMLYMLLEGNRFGRIFVDRPANPSVALICCGNEYAYLSGEAALARLDVVQTVEGTILPSLDEAGLDFMTIFPFGVSPAKVQAWFPKRQPVSFGVNSFTFERDRFETQRLNSSPLPAGYQMLRLDRHTLNQPAYQTTLEDILFCWGSLERFEALGLGYAIQNPKGEVVSACYAIAYGAQAYHINIWTHPAQRRKGLARQAALAFLDGSLGKDREIYWINDAPNLASRRLAESVGFVYAGDLATVDIPVHPHQFYLGLAEHFMGYLGLYRQAGELYDIAFAIQAGTSEAYQKAADVWLKAGDRAKAQVYEKKAASAS